MSIEPRAKDPDRLYEHRFHAGNAGDVWKHVALLALLQRASDAAAYVETHAGAGRYRLPPTGEWREGVGRLLELERGGMPEAVRRYVDAVAPAPPRGGGLDYPGSPLLAAARLPAGAALRLYELFDGPRRELQTALGADARVVVHGKDGLAALASGLAADLAADTRAVVLVDPPFKEKQEWTELPRALAAAARALPHARLMAWYPIKSHTRPNTMLAQLRQAGVSGAASELITAPLALRKNRLAGSGLVLVRPPAGLLEELAAASTWLGPRLCIHEAAWSAATQSWGEAETEAP